MDKNDVEELTAELMYAGFTWDNDAAVGARVVLASDWLARERARIWDEAAEATSEWMWNNPSPSGIPHDPPRNPYEEP